MRQDYSQEFIDIANEFRESGWPVPEFSICSVVGVLGPLECSMNYHLAYDDFEGFASHAIKGAQIETEFSFSSARELCHTNTIFQICIKAVKNVKK